MHDMKTEIRHFHDWRTPILQAGVQVLTEKWLPTQPLDLRDTWVLIPSRHAGRRLRAELARIAGKHHTGVLIGEVTPLPAFLHAMLPPSIASSMHSQAIGARLIQENREWQNALLPATDTGLSFSSAFHLATELQTIRGILAEGMQTVENLLALDELPQEEKPRWKAIQEWECQVRNELAKHELLDEYDALQQLPQHLPKPFRFQKICLLFINQIPPLAEAVLRALQKRGVRVEIHILAPEAEKEFFDDMGRPISTLWENREIPISTEQIHAYNQTPDEMDALVRHIAEGRNQHHDIALCTPEVQYARSLAQVMHLHQQEIYLPNEISLQGTSIGCLLTQWAQLHRQQGDYPSVSAWLRNPDVRASIPQSGAMLTELDRLQNRHLPVTGQDVACALNTASDLSPTLKNLFEQLNSCGMDGASWAKHILDLLQTVYARQTLEERTEENGIPFADGAKATVQIIRDIARLTDTCSLSVSDAFDLLLTQLQQEKLYPPPPDHPVLEAHGWLDIHWTQASVVLLADMREGVLPESQFGDPFLPDSLRRAAGLPHNAERLARDLHWLMALLSSRHHENGAVHFFYSRRDAQQNPQIPSRLLLATSDDSLPARVTYLFTDIPASTASHPASSGFQLHPFQLPDSASIPTKLNVTQFHDYLQDPFRFYLRHILRMSPLDDTLREMDALNFGTLAHQVLSQLLHLPSTMRTPDEIADFLIEHLEQFSSRQFGSAPSLPVRIQLDSLRRRLRAAAVVHAECLQEGWQIVETEKKLSGELNGIQIEGKLDRIDYHPEKGWRIMDYKTGETAKTPMATHRFKGEWLDLQLPLYHFLFRPHAENKPIQTAYFNLPKSPEHTGLNLFEELTHDWLDLAEQCACEVIDGIRNRHFWPPKKQAAFMRDDFADILRAGPDGLIPPDFPATDPT